MHYIGIDLGTTNSAICSFDGSETRVWKSPEQSDVTPSAIYVDRRGRRFYGRRAYEMAPTDAANAATLFKRYLGTTMKFSFAHTGEELTPEECSAEILRVLFGYLPAEWQQSGEVATVITVPAAFNQMKKDATLQAAELAQIGQVAVMQEPVAAVMSVMKDEPIDGTFVVYDLGGGTFDVSVAEHVAGQVNLLAQGGKEMCGGRDWDRLLLREVVLPWLREHFSLPPDVERNPGYRRLRQLATFACEQAKIELSRNEDAYIQMDEARLSQRDLDDVEMYLDVPITRSQLTSLITDLMATTVTVARETIAKAGVAAADIKEIVFIGGPTVYPPLQEYVMGALGIRDKGLSDPMTAVAEGASIYAESIDWSSDLHERKEAIRRTTESDFDINFEQRSSADFARLAVSHHEGEAFSMEVTSEVDGWASGRQGFDGRGVMKLPLSARGVNSFRLALFDDEGQPVSLADNRLVVEHVLATVTAIPSSHAIAIKALDRVGGHAVPVYLVRENERLPKRGSITLRAGQRLVAGSSKSLVFTLWEGGIEDPIEDNRYIGAYRISGGSFSSGVIAVGDEIVCDYEVNEAGQLRLGATVPAVRSVFANQNYYSRFEGQLVLDNPSTLLRSGRNLRLRIAELQGLSYSAQLAEVSERLDDVLEQLQSDDAETVQQAADDLYDCQREVARFRQTHLHSVRLADLAGYKRLADSYEGDLSPEDAAMLNELYVSARRAIDHHGETYEAIVKEYSHRIWVALQSSEDFLRAQFMARTLSPDRYEDPAQFAALKAEGQACIENHDLTGLRRVMARLTAIRKPEEQVDSAEEMFEDVNVLRG